MSSGLHDRLIEQVVEAGGVTMLIGAPDTGKTTLARAILARAVAHGRVAAYVDADVGQSTVGPPTCTGLRWIRTAEDLTHIEHAHELRFVGGISPDGLVLQEVVGTATLTEVARGEADVVVVDTTGTISGVVGQTLKYHKMELCRPDRVVALQRGSELEPIDGMLRRFFNAEVIEAPVDPDVRPVSPEERAENRTAKFKAAFAGPLERWRVRPTVFAPTLPAGLDLGRLDRMLVGIQDGTGRCLGLGVLEHADGVLRVRTNAGEGMRGLRLGSLRIDLTTYRTERVNLREVMFGFDR